MIVDSFITPVFVGHCREIGVVVARIAGDLRVDPLGQRDLLRLGLQLYFGNQKACVVAQKRVDLPAQPCVLDNMTHLLHQRPVAEREECFDVFERNRVLKLSPAGSRGDALDRQKAMLPRHSDAHGSVLVAVEVALAVVSGRGALPVGACDEKLALYLRCHVDDHTCKDGTLRKSIA